MRHAAVVLIAAAALCGSADAGTLAGAQDGGYRASDGDFLLVDSKEDLVGVQGLDCHKAVVVGGRLTAKDCWANGHLGGDVDVSWRVEGHVVVSEGKRYVLSPPLPPPDIARLKAPVDPFEPSEEGWLHNRSEVRVDPKGNRITYSRPKPGLAGVVKAGSVLYQGDLKPGSLMLGTAFAFKEGCPPASYPVRGTYSQHNQMLVLTGPGPVRKGCEVVAYSYDSPHAKLAFEYVVGD